MSKNNLLRVEMERVQRIEQLKQHFGIDNVELARHAGVSKQAVNGWLRRGVKPSADALINLRRNLGVSDVWLLHGQGPMLQPKRDSIRYEIDQMLDQADDLDLNYIRSRLRRILDRDGQE